MKAHAAILTFIFFALSLPVTGGERFYTYKNQSFNYEIKVPASWRSTDLNLENKHVMYASPDKSTWIKVKAVKSSEEDLEMIARDNRWNMRQIDSRLNEIIETGKIAIKQSVTGKLLVFEYHSDKKRVLRRTLITINGGIVYIIECTSPTKNFYTHDEAFNTALSSFNFLGSAPLKEESPALAPGDREGVSGLDGSDLSDELSNL